MSAIGLSPWNSTSPLESARRATGSTHLAQQLFEAGAAFKTPFFIGPKPAYCLSDPAATKLSGLRPWWRSITPVSTCRTSTCEERR